MKHSYCRLQIASVLFAAIATTAIADDTKDAAIKKDRKQIAGTWRVVALEVNGNKASVEDAKRITVANAVDGTWVLSNDGKVINKGPSTIDPTVKLKTIDFKPSEGEGKGQEYLGIYELGAKTRKICFAPPGKKRPTEFSSKTGSEQYFVTFERVEAK